MKPMPNNNKREIIRELMHRRKSFNTGQCLVKIPGPTVLKNSMHWRYKQQLNSNFGEQKFECKMVKPNGTEVMKPGQDAVMKS